MTKLLPLISIVLFSLSCSDGPQPYTSVGRLGKIQIKDTPKIVHIEYDSVAVTSTSWENKIDVVIRPIMADEVQQWECEFEGKKVITRIWRTFAVPMLVIEHKISLRCGKIWLEGTNDQNYHEILFYN